LQQIFSAIKPTLLANQHYDQNWGDRNWFAVGLHASLQANADQNVMKTNAAARATGTVLNHDWDIVNIKGLAETPNGMTVQKMHANFVVTVCGDTLINIDNYKDGSLLITDKRSIGVDRGVSFHWVLVVVPIELKLGFHGSAGVSYGFDLAPLKAKALFTPFVNTTAYGQASADLGIASAGVQGVLTLLNASLPIGATVGVETGQQPVLFAEYYIQNTVNALSGRLFAFAEIDYWIGSDSWSWDIFKWNGFKYNGYFVNERVTIPLASGGGSEACIPFNPATTTVQNIQNTWKIVDGINSLFAFGTNKAAADRALAVIKFYNMNRSCIVGPLFNYLLVGTNAPTGTLSGEDCIPFNPATAQIQQINGRWKIVDGNMWMYDFAGNQIEAQQSLDIIKKYGFTYQCFVARPNPPFQYLHK
jgi:hypothetical protein